MQRIIRSTKEENLNDFQLEIDNGILIISVGNNSAEVNLEEASIMVEFISEYLKRG